MWFFDIKDKLWHKSPGPVGKPAMCGQRWGHSALDFTMSEPDYGEKCSKCEGKIKEAA